MSLITDYRAYEQYDMGAAGLLAFTNIAIE